jgi:DNA-binding transcriptional MerR regulator
MSQEAGLDEVRAEDITQLLDSQGQQHSNKNLEDVVKELSQQKKEQREKEKEPPLKCMTTSDIQHSFSAMENVTGEL